MKPFGTADSELPKAGRLDRQERAAETADEGASTSEPWSPIDRESRLYKVRTNGLSLRQLAEWEALENARGRLRRGGGRSAPGSPYELWATDRAEGGNAVCRL